MINHIGKYNDAQAIQDALDAGTLANPYVAMTSAGTIDYNSLQPTPPAPSTMGYWTNGEGTSESPYIFHITEEDTSYWEQDVYIGQLLTIYFSEEVPVDFTMVLQYQYDSEYPENSLYAFKLIPDGGQASDGVQLDLHPDMPDSWCCGESNIGMMTTIETSDAYVSFSWDGEGNISMWSDDSSNELAASTHDPEYPEVGE